MDIRLNDEHAKAVKASNSLTTIELTLRGIKDDVMTISGNDFINDVIEYVLQLREDVDNSRQYHEHAKVNLDEAKDYFDVYMQDHNHTNHPEAAAAHTAFIITNAKEGNMYQYVYNTLMEYYNYLLREHPDKLIPNL